MLILNIIHYISLMKDWNWFAYGRKIKEKHVESFSRMINIKINFKFLH